jgi:hypothetical protein
MFHGLVYLEYGGDINITNVSGFYGPGAVLAWLLTAVLTAVSYRRAKLDPAGFTVTFVYASVAAIDFILHVSKGEYDAQYDAALAVCIYVTIFPALCLHGPVRYTFFTRWIWWQVRADNWSTVHPNYYSGWSLGYEVKVWVRMLLFTICGIPTLVNFFIPCFSMIGFAKAFPILVYGAF